MHNKNSNHTVLVSDILILTATALANATYAAPDTLQERNLDELNVVAIKQVDLLREDAVSATVIGRSEIEELSISGMKTASNVIPNF